MKSRILHGSVWHMRLQPRYFFRYGVFYFELALDEFEYLTRSLWLFSRNRFNLVSFRDADYEALECRSAATASPLALPGAKGSLTLVTHPRVLGYAFNPVSFFLHRGAEGPVDHVVAEVHNTWGERHVYDLAPVHSRAVYRAEADKDFYVSPFIDPEGAYSFRLQETPDRMRLRIDETRPGEAVPFFRAGMDLKALPLTNVNALAMLARYPLVTLKTTAAIHWQGLKLWVRGEHFRPNPRRASRKAKVAA